MDPAASHSNFSHSNFSGLVLVRGTQNLRFGGFGRRSFNISGSRVVATPWDLRFGVSRAIVEGV